MTEIIKLEVRIPKHRKDELLALAEEWREQAGHREPGWDAKAIARVAKKHYGGLREMYLHHSWPDTPGHKLLPHVQQHVAETYGTVENFLTQHEG